MNRRDMVIIAVLINAGLLSILFFMATVLDDESLNDSVDFQKIISSKTESLPIVLEAPTNETITHRDEIDAIVEDIKATTLKVEKKVIGVGPPKGTVDITVKRGDTLEKLARSNGTTVAHLMSINELQNDLLDVGQHLFVPVPTDVNPFASVDLKPKEEYYTVQSGDNPWKVAKKFEVCFNELLKMNNLTEEKARRLKAGDKLRIK